MARIDKMSLYPYCSGVDTTFTDYNESLPDFGRGEIFCVYKGFVTHLSPVCLPKLFAETIWVTTWVTNFIM